MTMTNSDPLQCSSYIASTGGYIDTGWMYLGMKTIIKIWDELSIFMESPANSTTKIQVLYMEDSEDDGWQEVTDTWLRSPYETNSLTTAPFDNRRMRLRLSFINGERDRSTGIKMFAMILDLYGIIPIKYVYSFPIVVADQWQEVDLQGDKQKALGYTAAASTAITKLRAWASAGTPLTLHSNVAAMDDTTVIMQGPPLRPVRIDNVGQAEKYLLNVVCRDV